MRRGLRPLAAVQYPGTLGEDRQGFRGQIHRFHELAQQPVGQQDGGIPVFVGQLESQLDEGVGFFHGGGGQDQGPVIAVAASFHRLEVIGLGRLDVAQPGAAPHDVHQHAGYLAAGQVGNRLLHQAEPGGRGGGHGARSGHRGAEAQVDRGEFAFGLDEGPARLGHPAGHGRRDLVLGGDGITGVKTATGGDGRLGDHLVAFNQGEGHLRASPAAVSSRIQTLMAMSGHIKAQMPHPVQSESSRNRMGT